MRTKYKPWAQPYLLEHQEIQISEEDISHLQNVNLEIGAGKGAFIVELAKRNIDEQYIAIEKNLTCAGFIAKKLVEEHLENVKLINADAEDVLRILSRGSVKNIYLNFSDPWPKKKHAKRRLTSFNFIDEYIRVLKIGGEIHFKTDEDTLYEFSKKAFKRNGLKVLLDEIDYHYDEGQDPLTEYEIKKRNEGKKIHRIFLTKTEDIINQYGLYYSYKNDKTTLKIIFADEMNIKAFDSSKISVESLSPYQNYLVHNINKIIKIKAEGMLPNNNHELVNILNQQIKKMDLPILKEYDESGFYVGKVISTNPNTVLVRGEKYILQNQEDLKINDRVIFAFKGTFTFLEQSLKENRLCYEDELGISDKHQIYRSEELPLNKDFYKIVEELKK